MTVLVQISISLLLFWSHQEKLFCCVLVLSVSYQWEYTEQEIRLKARELCPFTVTFLKYCCSSAWSNNYVSSLEKGYSHPEVWPIYRHSYLSLVIKTTGNLKMLDIWQIWFTLNFRKICKKSLLKSPTLPENNLRVQGFFCCFPVKGTWFFSLNNKFFTWGLVDRKQRRWRRS